MLNMLPAEKFLPFPFESCYNKLTEYSTKYSEEKENISGKSQKILEKEVLLWKWKGECIKCMPGGMKKSS